MSEGPKALSLEEAAKALGQSEKTLRRWVEAGCPHHKAEGRTGKLTFDQAEVVGWLRSMGKSGARGRPVGGGGLRPQPRQPGADAEEEADDETPAKDLTQEQIYKLTAAANLRIKELEAEKRTRLEQEARGELLDSREVDEAWAAEGIRVRVALEAVPARLAGQLVGLEKAEIEAQLAAAMRGVLSGLSEKAPGVK